ILFLSGTCAPLPRTLPYLCLSSADFGSSPTPVRADFWQPNAVASLLRGIRLHGFLCTRTRAFLIFSAGDAMANRNTARNDYRCSMERNQGGKYCVRIQVHYPRHAWTLGVYFLASSFDRAMKKLEEGLDFLQRNEEKLWFWGVDRAEDLGF